MSAMTVARPKYQGSEAIAPEITRRLQEAIREIQIIAGLDVTRPTSPGNVRPVTIGVTSADYGDGKTTVAIALASSLAHDFGTPVTLVDADLHTHSIGRQYVLDELPGLRETLAGEFRPEDVLYPFNGSTVHIMPAGGLVADPARLARSERLGPVLDSLKSRSSNVVLDLPAVLHSMNTPALAQRCDGVIIVVRHGKTTRADLDRVLHLLAETNVIGVVVNRHRTSVPAWVQRLFGLRR